MKWSMAALLAVGVIAALCAAVLVASLRSSPAKPAAEHEGSEATIVVATKDLPAMSVVQAGSVEQITVPRDEVPEGAFTHPGQIVGKVLSTRVIEGQVFTRNRCVSESPGLDLASAIPEGMRAVSILLEDDGSLKGLLYPGSRVDVLATFRLEGEGVGRREAVSTVLLHGVQVLAVEDRTVVSGDEAGKEASSVYRRRKRLVTLMVDTDQAEALQLAAAHGDVSLALRNPMDEAPVTAAQRRLSELSIPELNLDPATPSEGGEAAPRAPRDRWETHIIRGASQETKVFSVGASPSRAAVAD